MLTVFYAVLRRFLAILATGVLAWLGANWSDALAQAVRETPVAALWLPVIFLVVELVQKTVRTLRQ